MGYDVAIVCPPLPDSDAEARQHIDAWIEERGAALDVFRRLYDLLIDRYPRVTSLSDHDADNGVWKDSPLWNNFGPRAAVLGIVFPRADEALPFVIETATSLGPGFSTSITAMATVFRSPVAMAALPANGASAMARNLDTGSQAAVPQYQRIFNSRPTGFT